MKIFILEHPEIDKFEDIKISKRSDGKNSDEYFYNVERTAQKHICNM